MTAQRGTMTAIAIQRTGVHQPPQVDWQRVARNVLLCRALDDLEETRLLPERKILYQFTARGHDVSQSILAQMLTGARDAASVYYRSRAVN